MAGQAPVSFFRDPGIDLLCVFICPDRQLREKIMNWTITTNAGRWRLGTFISILACLVLAGPVYAQGFSVAFNRIEYEVSPGDLKSGSIGVTNLSSEPMTLRIYAGDWTRITGDSSGYVFDDEGGNEPRSFLDWMTFSPDRMTLQPGEWRDVQYEIRIPNQGDLEGSYWGVIFIEETPDVLPEQGLEEPDVMRVGILTVFRYAVQIYVTVVGTEVREVTFDSINFEQAQDGIDVTAVIENLGNIYMRPKVWLELRDTSGNVVYSQEHIRQTLLPESLRDYKFEIRELSIEPGVYLAIVIADYDSPTLIAAQGRIEITPGQTGDAPDEEVTPVE